MNNIDTFFLLFTDTVQYYVEYLINLKLHFNFHEIYLLRLFFPLSQKIPSNTVLIKVINRTLQAPEHPESGSKPRYPPLLTCDICLRYFYLLRQLFSHKKKIYIFIKVKKLKCIRFFLNVFCTLRGLWKTHIQQRLQWYKQQTQFFSSRT